MSSNAKAALVVVIAFLAGIFVGVAGDHFILIHRGQLFPRRGAEFAARHLVDHLNRELHLSDAQRASIQRIIDTHHVRIQAVWNNVRPQVQREIDSANAEIENVLNPEQRAKFRELRSRERRRHRGGPPRPF